jgi:hypothetical protein
MTLGQYGELLGTLSAARAERVRRLEELAAFDAEQVQQWTRQVEEALSAVERDFETARADLDRMHAEAIEELAERRSLDEDAAHSEFGRKSGEIELNHDADLAAAETKYKENCWLVQSILDDASDASPKVQFERLQAQLEQARERLTRENDEISALYRKAVATVERRWQQVGPPPTPGSSPASRDEAEDEFSAAAEGVRQGSARLFRQVAPELFARWYLVALALLLAAGCLFGMMYFFIDPDWLGLVRLDRTMWAAISGGVAVGACVIMAIVLWQVSVHQTTKVFEPLAQQFADAQAAYQRWQKLADADFRRAEHDYQTRYVAIVERRDRSLAQFEAEYRATVEELDVQRRQALFAVTQKRDAALQAAAERYEHGKRDEEAAYRAAGTALEANRQQQRHQIMQQYSQAHLERTQRRNDLWTRCESEWTAALERVRSEVTALERENRRFFPDWSQIADARWTPPEQLPPGIRLGDFLVRFPEPTSVTGSERRQLVAIPEFRLPAVLTFPDSPSLVLKASGPGRSEGVAILQVAVLRLLTSLPPGDVRLTLIDPVGLGENFASFMHLADYDDLLITNRIWTEPAQIEEQLAKLTEHMENVFQKYLRNEFDSIEEYNRHAGEVAEPYRLLVVADFPNGFTERAAQRLMSIASSGARCGVHTLVAVDAQQPMPRGFDLSRLEAGATVLEWKSSEEDGGRFWTRGTASHSLPLIPDPVPAATIMAGLIRKIGELSKDVRRVEVPFHRIAPRPEAYWTADSRAGIDVPLGRAGATKLQHLRLGQGTSQHVLVAGKTGSGKSTLLHVIVTDLALRYSPDEIEFYLIDFKKGVEFKTYAAHRLPHARVIAIESDREFGASVLERLDGVLKERGDLFRQAGAQDIKSFRDARPDVKLPRILLIVDEFQEFFVEDDKYSQTASLLLDRLVRQGRAFGIHVLLGSQTLGGAYSLARTTIGQMAVRIALQCSETDAHLILSENNGAARLLTRPGEAIYNDANGLMEGNHPFQVAWLDDDQRDDFLSRIARLAGRRDASWPEPIVFEGNLPADPLRNRTLCELIASERTQPVAEPSPRIWLGDAVAIAGPAEVRFFARSGANLLLVGQDPNSALGVMTAGIAALVAQSVGRLELLADASAGVHHGRWTPFLNSFADRVRCTDEPDRLLGEFAAEVARRLETSETSPPWFLVIDDLSRYRELRKSEDDFGFGGFDKKKASSPGQMFADIVKDGPGVGVHVVVWCDSYNNVDRWFGRQLLREFEMRVVFQMSPADSSNLIDSPAASRLGNHRAILYSDERGTTEKFRPYGPPSEAWLAWLKRREQVIPTDGNAEITNSSRGDDFPKSGVRDDGSESVSAINAGDANDPSASAVDGPPAASHSEPRQLTTDHEPSTTGDDVQLQQSSRETLKGASPKAWPTHPLQNVPGSSVAGSLPDDADVPDDVSAWTVR